MNRYTYALNAPVNFTDPMGLAAVGSVGGTARGVSSASTGGNGWLGWLQGGLDVVGATAEYVLPGPGTAIGTLADVASAGISWWQGDNLAASASLAAALPYVGSVALIAKAIKQVDGVVGAAKGPVRAFEVGRADDLLARSVRGDRLDVHHVGQAHPLEQIIPGYDRASAPAVMLPRVQHAQIPTVRGPYTGSARDQLAKDIRDLRNYTDAPNSSLRELIDLNKQLYPGSFGR